LKRSEASLEAELAMHPASHQENVILPSRQPALLNLLRNSVYDSIEQFYLHFTNIFDSMYYTTLHSALRSFKCEIYTLKNIY